MKIKKYSEIVFHERNYLKVYVFWNFYDTIEQRKDAMLQYFIHNYIIYVQADKTPSILQKCNLIEQFIENSHTVIFARDVAGNLQDVIL